MPGSFPLLRKAAPPLVVALITAVNLFALRATLLPVSYLNDSALHSQMVRYATTSFRAGRIPLTGWYPYLNLGSPHFLHYQSLGAMITGLAGLAVGPNVAFRWSLWLMIGGWPVIAYLSARIFGLSRWAAVGAAGAAPLVASIPGAGYETDGYLWVGFGLWAQLWGSMALPFAWATTWRATSDRRFVLPAGLTVAATISLHYETGYLALMAVVLMPFAVFRGFRRRVLRAACVLGIAVLAAAWTLVPLATYARYAAINQALVGTPLENGYGARQVMTWLVSGSVFDGRGWPVVTLAVLAGVIVAIICWRRFPTGRVLLIVGVASLILCFGRTTFGSLVDIVPASHDVFFRRFMLGAQLAGIYLAGMGVVGVGRVLSAAAVRVGQRWGPSREPAPAGDGSWAILRWVRDGISWPVASGLRLGAVVIAVALIGLGAWPALNRADDLSNRNAAAIAYQRTLERAQAPQIGALLDYVRAHGGGRVYAGSPNNWGNTFQVGEVQVYKYLANQDIDGVGFTLRTASLMSQPEFQFQDNNASDYALFGIRYLILPKGMVSPVPADSIMERGKFHLLEIPANGYISVIDTVGSLAANRANVGTQSVPYLESGDFGEHKGLTVAWDGDAPATPTAPSGTRLAGSPGVVDHTVDDLVAGRVSTQVTMNRRAVVMLSASYDPGWQVTVDGVRASTQIIAPAVVGVVVPPGAHRIVFSYHGYPHYPFLIGALILAVVCGVGLSFGRRRLLRR